MNQLAALGLTLACEVPLLLALSRLRPQPRPQPRPHLRRHAPWRVLLVAASASLLTHPLAWRMALLLSPQEYGPGLIAIEACVVLAEALWLHAWLRVGLATSLAWSCLANAASFLLGWMLSTS